MINRNFSKIFVLTESIVLEISLEESCLQGREMFLRASSLPLMFSTYSTVE